MNSDTLIMSKSNDNILSKLDEYYIMSQLNMEKAYLYTNLIEITQSFNFNFIYKVQLISINIGRSYENEDKMELNIKKELLPTILFIIKNALVNNFYYDIEENLIFSKSEISSQTIFSKMEDGSLLAKMPSSKTLEQIYESSDKIYLKLTNIKLSQEMSKNICNNYLNTIIKGGSNNKNNSNNTSFFTTIYTSLFNQIFFLSHYKNNYEWEGNAYILVPYIKYQIFYSKHINYFNYDLNFILVNKIRTYMDEILEYSNGSFFIPDFTVEIIKEKIKGKLTITLYNERIYKIKDIIFNVNVKEFYIKSSKDNSDKVISLYEYYEQNYGIKLKYEITPLFCLSNLNFNFKYSEKEESINTDLSYFNLNENKQRIFLLPELCNICHINIDEFEDKITKLNSNNINNEVHYNIFFKDLDNNISHLKKKLDNHSFISNFIKTIKQSYNNTKKINNNSNSNNCININEEFTIDKETFSYHTDITNYFNFSDKQTKVSFEKFNDSNENEIKFLFNKSSSGKRESLRFDIDYSNKNLDLVENLVNSYIYEPVVEAPPIPNLAVISTEEDSFYSQELIKWIEKLCHSKCIKSNKIELIKVSKEKSYNNNNPFSEWEKTLGKIASPSLIGVIAVIPDNSNKGLIYKFVKRFMLVSYPIPCQCVLNTNLMNKNKKSNIKIIASKIVNQLLCKMNGEPWRIKDLPFSDVPTMIVGIHDFFIKNAVTLSLISTYTKYYSKVYSLSKTIENFSEEISCKSILEMLLNSLANFHLSQQTLPINIIIYRENTLPFSSINNLDDLFLLERDVLALLFNDYDDSTLKLNLNKEFINSHIESLGKDIQNVYSNIKKMKVKWSYILVNRNPNNGVIFENKENLYSRDSEYKGFENSSNSFFDNIIIREGLTDEKSEFYLLMSNNTNDIITEYEDKKNRSGYDDFNIGKNEKLNLIKKYKKLPYKSSFYKIVYKHPHISNYELESLTLKLCYTYFNYFGGFNVPSVLQYAKKLTFLVGDTLSEEDCRLNVSERFSTQINSLFYI